MWTWPLAEFQQPAGYCHVLWWHPGGFVISVVTAGATSGLHLRTRRNWVKTLPGSSGPAAMVHHVPPTFLKASSKFQIVEGRPGMRVLLVGFFQR
jgi:hypothetical protein